MTEKIWTLWKWTLSHYMNIRYPLVTTCDDQYIMFIIPIIIIRMTWLEHFGTYWKHGKNVLSWNSKSLWEAVVYYTVSKLVVWSMLFKTTSNVLQVWNNNFMFIWNEVHGVTTKWDVVFGFPLSMIQPFTIFCFKM